MTASCNVLAICGSLRKAATNRLLLRAAIGMAPAGMTIVEHPIGDLPLFNEDIEKPSPAAAVALRDAVVAADALLFVTPEYNHGPSAAMKNVVDWLSRGSLGKPPGTAPIIGRIAAVMGASGGVSGSMRSQVQLRANLWPLQVHVMPMPPMILPGSGSKFGSDGALNDEPSKKALADFLAAFAKWIERMKR